MADWASCSREAYVSLIFTGDERWVQWRARDQKSYRVPALLERLKVHHADSYGWALACCAWQPEVAEDVLQEAYLRVLDGRASYQGKSALRTWFFAVIRRVAMETRRAQQRGSVFKLRLISAGQSLEEGLAAPPGDQLYQQRSSDQLRLALMSLSERQREILHLVFYAEMTLEEAADTVGISTGSARTHYHRGKERLAQLLELEEAND